MDGINPRGLNKGDNMIPKSFVDENLAEAKGCSFFGVPIENLSRDELVACAVVGWKAKEANVIESARQRDFLLSLHRG